MREAIKWYTRAGEAGNADALIKLVVAYANSDGVAVNKSVTIKWFRRAAEAGSADAQAKLDRML